eukprot:PhF_6_TR1008/c0_g1_i1/m.2008
MKRCSSVPSHRGSDTVDVVKRLEGELEMKNEQISKCVDYGLELVRKLEDSEAHKNELQSQLQMVREEYERLQSIISDVESEKRSVQALREVWECEKIDLLRENEDLKSKLATQQAFATKKSEELDRVASMRVVPSLNLGNTLTRLQSSQALGGLSVDMKPSNDGNGATPLSPLVVSAETNKMKKEIEELKETNAYLDSEVTRLQILLDEAFDDLENERRLRNELVARHQERGMGSSIVNNESMYSNDAMSPRLQEQATIKPEPTTDMKPVASLVGGGSTPVEQQLTPTSSAPIGIHSPTLLDDYDHRADASVPVCAMDRALTDWMNDDGSRTAREVAVVLTARGRKNSTADEDTQMLRAMDSSLKKTREEPSVINVIRSDTNACIPSLYNAILFLQGELDARWVHSVEWTGEDLSKKLQWRTVMDGLRLLIAKLHQHHNQWLQTHMLALTQKKTQLEGELDAALQTLKVTQNSQVLIETCRAKAALCRQHTIHIRQKNRIVDAVPLRIVFSRILSQLTAFIAFFGAMRLLSGVTLPDTVDHATLLSQLAACASSVFTAASFTLEYTPVLSLEDIERLGDITATTIIRKYEWHIMQLTFNGAIAFADSCVAYMVESILRFDVHGDLPLPDQMVAAVEGVQLITNPNRSKVGSRIVPYASASPAIQKLFALKPYLDTTSRTLAWTFQRVARDSGIATNEGKHYARGGTTNFGFRHDTNKHAAELGMIPYTGPVPPETSHIVWQDDEELLQLTPAYFSFTSPILASLMYAEPVLTAGLFVHQMRWNRPPLLMHNFVDKIIWTSGCKCQQCNRRVTPLTKAKICTTCECVVHCTCSEIARKLPCGSKAT